jgi:hypothetical protein
MISGCTVPWVASEHPEAVEIAMKWIESPKEGIAEAGWATLCAVASVVADEKLPVKELDALLTHVVKTIHTAPNRVRHGMNQFVICCGTYVAPLAEKALTAARKIGKVAVDMGPTACQVPDAEPYIIKSRRGLTIAPKRKTAKC